MFKSITAPRSDAEIAADNANLQWQADRRALRPQAAVNDFAGSSRVPEFAKLDPAQAKAQRDAERNNLERLRQQTKKKRFAVRKTALTQSWYSPDMRILRQDLEFDLSTYLDARMEQADCKVPEKMFSVTDWEYVIGAARDDFNADLEARGQSILMPEEGLALVHFCRSQKPPLYLGSESNLGTAFECLKALGVIRFAEPEVQAKPEPVAEEKNPFPYDSNPRSDHSQWDMAQYRRDKERELSVPFREGALSLGIALSEKDMKRLHVTLDRMRLPMTAANVRTAGIALWGEQVNMTDAELAEFETNREDAGLSGEDMKRKYGFVASYDPNRGANVRRS